MLQQMFSIPPSACNPVLPPDAGAPDAPAAAQGGGGGCGCSVAARHPGGGWLLLLIPLCALLLRCGEDGVPLPWSHTFTIPAGTFVEANLVMSSGDSATCDFSAQGGALDWNTHGHTADGGLFVLMQGQGAAGSIPLTVASGGGYSFYFQNNGGLPVTLDVHISGRGRVVSTSVGP